MASVTQETRGGEGRGLFTRGMRLVVAYVLSALLSAQLRRVGFYRFVWHRALFDFAIFVCLLGGVVYLSSEYLT